MSVASIRSLEKGVDLVMLFSERRPLLSLPEIAKELGLPQSTVYRLVVTLQKRNLLVRDEVSRKYGLDVSLLRIQGAILARLSIVSLAQPYLEDLALQSRETAHLYLLQGYQMVLAESVNSPETIRFAPDKGALMPLHAPAGGRAILAFLPQDFLSKYLSQCGLQRMTPHTVCDEGEFRKTLGEVRAVGFAVTTDQLYLGACAVAAPIFDHGDRVVGSLTIAGPTPRFGEEKVRQLAPLVLKHAADLSRQLGANLSAKVLTDGGPSSGRNNKEAGDGL